MEIFIEKFFEIVTNQWVLVTLSSLGFLIYMLRKGLNDLVSKLGDRLKASGKNNSHSEITIETFLNHDLFSELELQKHLINPNFFTYGNEDVNKNKIFTIFVEEKMDSVAWSMKKMLNEYTIDMSKDQLKSHVYASFLACDDNLECKLSARLLNVGVPKADVEGIIGKFTEVRSHTLKNYTNRIDRMFSFASQYNVSNKYLVLTLFEILSFEIRGMVMDINTTFDTINGDFLELDLV
jgi:hypothetical protein